MTGDGPLNIDLQSWFKGARRTGLSLNLDQVAEKFEYSGFEPSMDQVPDVIDSISQYGRGLEVLHTPTLVTHFVGTYLDGVKAMTLLDPHAGMGSLLATAQLVTGAVQPVAFERDPQQLRVGQMLNPNAEWHQGGVRRI